MSKHNNTSGDGAVRGAGYWRMSSDPQEKSIPQQRSEMLPKCRLHRVELVREFQDEAKSGGGMRKRDAFLSMVRYCQEQAEAGTPVNAVVCYDTSRFSRASSIKTARYIDDLMEAGVFRLLTCERWYDFRKKEDRAIFLLEQDFTNNEFLHGLSRRILRGRKDVVAAGFFAGGTTPYGFDRMLVDEKCQPRGTFRRGERFVKPKGWHVWLVPIPADDPDPTRQLERQTAAWLFETFAARDVSYRWLAEQLNLRGVPGAGSSYRVRGKDRKLVARAAPTRWTVRSVSALLQNPAYKGTSRFGLTGAGLYHRLVGGQIEAVEPGAGKTTNAEGLIFTPLEHGGYVSADLWDVVQAKVKERARLGLKPRQGGYTLPGGILYCGHCGHRMYGTTMRPRRGARQYCYKKYVCSAPNVKPGVCRAYSIDEDKIVKVLKDQLEKVYLAPERLAALEAGLLARAEAKHDNAPAEADRLRKRLEQLEQDIVRSRRRVLQAADDATFVELNNGLREQVEARDRLQKELARAEALKGEPVAKDEAMIREALAVLRSLAGELRRATGPEVGAVLRRLISRADLYFEEKANGGKRWYSFVKGVVKVRPVLDVQAFAKSGR
jgi:DNA invertase Pin-like site-specific DNA recombinase